MLDKMVKFNPGDRVTSEQALADPYFDVYSYPEDEPINQHPFQIESYVDDFMSDIKVFFALLPPLYNKTCIYSFIEYLLLMYYFLIIGTSLALEMKIIEHYQFEIFMVESIHNTGTSE